MKKSKIVLSCIFILIFGLLLARGLFTRNQIVYKIDTIDIHAGEYEKKIAENITLTPSIYRIDIDYQCSTNSSDMYIAFVTPRDKSVGKNGLKSTGGYLYLNKEYESQEFYLNEKTQDLYLELNAYYDDFSIRSIEIVNTGKSWFCRSFIVLCVYIVLMLTLSVCTRIKDGRTTDTEIARIIAYIGIWIISSIPILCGYTILTADGPYHMERVEGIANALRAGIIPVRLEPTWLQNYGYGNGLFYCDLFLVFPALLRLIGFSVTSSYNAYLLAVNALVIITGSYAFRTIVKNEHIALIMTAMYALSEIKYYQFINKGTLGEGTALIFLPLVLVGLYKILYTKNGWIWLAIGYSGLICSHILSTEITLFVAILIVLFNIRRVFKKNVIIDIAKSVGATVLLTCWFTVPFIESYLLEDVAIKHAFSRTIQGEGLRVSQLFINFFGRFSEGKTEGIYFLESVGMGVPLLIGLVVFVGIAIYTITKKRKTNQELGFVVGLDIIAIVLIVFSLRIFPWDAIQRQFVKLAPLISSIQFPRRFLEWGTLLSIVVLGTLLEYFLKDKRKVLFNSLMILTMTGIVFSFVSRLDYDVATKLKYPLGNFEGIRTDYVAGGEYVLYGTDLGKLEYSKIEASDEILCSDYSSGLLTGSIYAVNNGTTEGYVEFPLLNYRHYVANDNQGNKLQVLNGDNNVVRVIVPKGFSDSIIVRYKPPIYWHIAEIISVMSCIGLVWIVLKKKKAHICKES